MENLLFYDIEIFKKDWLVVFKDINKNVIKIYHNDLDDMEDLIEDKVLIGYNNYNYDDIILSKILKGWSNKQLKDLNDKIIEGKSNYKSELKNITYDCIQQISIAPVSLKYIEGNMGKSIKESSISFDIDRALTETELRETIDYCSYDVDTTIDVYKIRENSYFKTKKELVNMIDNKKAIKWNTTTISANLILEKPLDKWSSLRGCSKWENIIPGDVWNMWQEGAKFQENQAENKSIKKDMFGCEVVFGFGGLHGAPKRTIIAKNVKLLDVASMYPNIILNIGALGHRTSKYKGILDERLRIKHVDKLKSDALKLILNSVYGNLKNKYSILYNTRAAMSVCVYGQIALYNLCLRLNACGCRLININTDGVGFTSEDNSYKSIIKDWEEEFKLKLEEDDFDLFIQRDVNNYIGVKGDKIKCKGGDVKRYSDNYFFENNSIRIVDIAIVNKLVNGIDVLDTIISNLDKPYLFQYVLKAGSTFKGTYDNKGNQHQNYNRIFAAKDGDLVLKKMREDGGLVMFPDTPSKMFIWNDNCDKLNDFKNIVDINWYYQLINKKLEAWEV